MAGGLIVAGVAALLAACAFLFWFTRRQKTEAPPADVPEPRERLTFKKPDVEKRPSVAEFQKTLGRSAIIEYLPTDSYEKATITTVVNYLSSGKNVVLVSQAPRAGIYYEKLQYFIEKELVKIVDVTTESPLAKPYMFKVTTESAENSAADEKKGIISVSINNLEYLTEIAEQMPEGSVLIFEAMTGIILSLGSEKKEAVYKFFSGIVEEMSSKERRLVALLNRGAHEPSVVSAYEGLFVTILQIEGENIVTIKGDKKDMSLGVL